MASPAPLIVVSGPSGAGKGTVVKRLLEMRPDVFVSVSATTRPARSGERHGTDYLFVSTQQFLAMRDRGEFLEWAEVYGNLYGTPRAPIETALSQGKTALAELDIQGAQATKRAKPEAVLVFIEPPSLEDLVLRLRGRGTEDAESLSRRVKASYEEVKAKGVYDHIVVNQVVETAAAELLRILEEQEKARR